MPTPRPQTVTINLSSLSIAKVLIVVAVLGFLYLIKDIVAILFISLILASALGPTVAALERRKVPRALAILIIYAGFASLFIVTILLLIPVLAEQFRDLSARFPVYSDQILGYVKSVSGGSEEVVIAQIKSSLKAVESGMLQVASGIFLKIFDIIGGIAGIVLVSVITFYMTIEESIMKRTLNAMVPSQYHEYSHLLVGRIQKKIGQWLRAQVILCFIIFFCSFLGLTILGVDYALILALIAGLTEFIPVVGPTIGAVPAIIVALGQSPWLALSVAFLYYLIQWLENHVLVPKVMQQTIGINPLISIIAVLVGAKIGGIVGVMLAIPVATVLGLFVNDFFGSYMPHDESENALESEK